MAVKTKSEKYPKSRDRWTKAELKRLRKLYPIYSCRRLIREFDRTEASIDNKASMLGLKKDVSKGYRGVASEYRIWRDDEQYFLRSHYKKMSYSEIAAALDRSCSSVTHKARSMKLGREKRKKWTKKEKKYLKRFYETQGSIEIAKALNRSSDGVLRQAMRMNLHRIYWTKQADDKLRELYANHSNKWLADKFNRSVHTIVEHGKKLGLRKLRRWTEKEKQYLSRYYEKEGAEAAAKALNINIGGIIHQVSRMGLHRKRIYWTKEEDVKFRELYATHTNKWLAGKFNRGVSAIKKHGRKLGLVKL